MFDDDPRTVQTGEEHEIMPYLRAWRPTFIYVSLLLLVLCVVINKEGRKI